MVPEAHCKNHPEVYFGNVRCTRCGEWFCPNCRVEIDGRPYCAQCKTEHVRDLRAGVAAPGVGDLPYASVGRRFGAVFLDGLIFTIPYAGWFIYMIATAEAEGEPSTAAMIGLVFALLWLTVGRVVYEGVMLGRGGQTLGKRAMDVKVVTPEGRDIRPGQAWGRAVMRFVLDSCLSLINYLPALFTKEKTAVHDMVVKTRVVDVRYGAPRG
jgi:uncharacterized RDD family membrane protein YckC